MENEIARDCQNCGASLKGSFCHECGQKLIQDEDKKLKHFIIAFFSSLFFADGKALRSFKTLFSKPGELSRAFIQGARRKYLAPLQMFFFVNLLYFIFPVISTFNTSLSTQLKRLPYSSYVKEIVIEHLTVNEIEYEEFREEYERKSASNAKLLLIVLVSLQGLSLKLLFIRRKDLFITDFLAASAYFTSAYIFALLIVLPSLIIGVDHYIENTLTSQLNLNDVVLSMFFLLLIALYLISFLKKAFEISHREAIWRSILLTVLLVPIFHLFRFLLFWVTYWMVV